MANWVTNELSNQLAPRNRVLLQDIRFVQLLKVFETNLWIPKVYYRARKSPPLVHILSQINPAHNALSYFLWSILMLSYLFMSFPGQLIPSDFRFEAFYIYHLSPLAWVLHALSISSWFEHANILGGVTIMQFSPASWHFLRRSSKYSSQPPVLK